MNERDIDQKFLLNLLAIIAHKAGGSTTVTLEDMDKYEKEGPWGIVLEDGLGHIRIVLEPAKDE